MFRILKKPLRMPRGGFKVVFGLADALGAITMGMRFAFPEAVSPEQLVA